MVPLKKELGPFDGLLREVVLHLGLEAHVPAPMYAPPGVRLVVDRSNQQIWLDGVLLTEVKADTNAFNFIACVTEARGEVVTKPKISARVSPASEDEQVPKQARLSAVKAILRSFEASGQMPPEDYREIFKSRGGGYHVTIRAHVV